MVHTVGMLNCKFMRACLPVCFLIYWYTLWYLRGLIPLVIVCMPRTGDQPKMNLTTFCLKDVLPTVSFVNCGNFYNAFGRNVEIVTEYSYSIYCFGHSSLKSNLERL